MIQGDDPEEKVEIYYRDEDSAQGSIHEIDGDLESLIRFLGHETTVESPAPGIGLSYAQTVGALHQMWSQRHLAVDFKAEQDRILAAIMRRDRRTELVDRPEFAEPDSRWFTPQTLAPQPASEG